MRNVILFGSCPSGGKGTQLALVSEMTGFHTAGVSKLLEPILVDSSHYRAMVKRGDLLPDPVVIPAVEKALKRGLAKHKTVILEGFPRSEAQAYRLLEFTKRTFKGVVFRSIWLDVDENVARSRAKNRGRDDDTDAAIDNRFQVFTLNRPIVLRGLQRLKDHNGQRAHVVVNGNPSQDIVYKDVVRVLENWDLLKSSVSVTV